jgi:hypothetical protein
MFSKKVSFLAFSAHPGNALGICRKYLQRADKNNTWINPVWERIAICLPEANSRRLFMALPCPCIQILQAMSLRPASIFFSYAGITDSCFGSFTAALSPQMTFLAINK